MNGWLVGWLDMGIKIHIKSVFDCNIVKDNETGENLNK